MAPTSLRKQLDPVPPVPEAQTHQLLTARFLPSAWVGGRPPPCGAKPPLGPCFFRTPLPPCPTNLVLVPGSFLRTHWLGRLFLHPSRCAKLPDPAGFRLLPCHLRASLLFLLVFYVPFAETACVFIPVKRAHGFEPRNTSSLHSHFPPLGDDHFSCRNFYVWLCYLAPSHCFFPVLGFLCQLPTLEDEDLVPLHSLTSVPHTLPIPTLLIQPHRNIAGAYVLWKRYEQLRVEDYTFSPLLFLSENRFF